MSDGMFVLPVTRPIGLPFDAAEKLIREGDGEAALLYIYLLRSGGHISVPEAAAAMGRTVSEIKAGISKLSTMGLVNVPGNAQTESAAPERSEMPEYTSADIEREMNSKSSFAPLVSEVQSLLGKIFSSADLMMLYGIYDSLGLPAEVVLLLVSHCIEEYRGKFGPGRVPSMRTIEKKAYAWAKNELFTLESAEDYIKRQNELKSAEEQIKQALGIGGRALSPTETRYIRSWIELGFDAEALVLAYDRTVVKTGKLTWAYMNSIVCSWDSKGLHSVSEIENKEPNGGKPKAANSKYDEPDEPDEDEIERLKRNLRRLRGEEE